MPNPISNAVADEEEIARLLFYPQMVNQQDELKKSAFSMEELMEEGGHSLSVDRCRLMGKDFHRALGRKAGQFASADKGRAKHGYCLAVVKRIRSIRGASNEQLFEVQADAIVQARPDPWDQAHAKIVSASPSHTKGYLRGYRDKLCGLFSAEIRRF